MGFGSKIAKDRPRTRTTTSGQTLTKRSFSKGANINNIMKIYTKTGRLGTGEIEARRAKFGDFTGTTNTFELLLKVKEAERAFKSLPAKTRARFKNKPENLIEFLKKQENLVEAIQLDLATMPKGMIINEEGKLVKELTREERIALAKANEATQ